MRGKIGVTFDSMALMGGSGMLILRGSMYRLIQFERKQIARHKIELVGTRESHK